MAHELWTTHNWDKASEEEVIQALLNAPPDFINPSDVADIQRYHPQAKHTYLNMFYRGEIPGSVKRLHKL